jgi:hypothetical protein
MIFIIDRECFCSCESLEEVSICDEIVVLILMTEYLYTSVFSRLDARFCTNISNHSDDREYFLE